MMRVQNLVQDGHRVSTRLCHRSFGCLFLSMGKWEGLWPNWWSVEGLKKILGHGEEHTLPEKSRGENWGEGRKEQSEQLKKGQNWGDVIAL